MSTFTKQPLSGSTNGLGIKIAATGSPGTLLHTAIAGITSWDEVWLWIMNTSAADCLATIQFGGTTAVDNDLILTIASKDAPKCICPGFILQNGLLIKAYAGTTNVLVAYGFVNRIAP